MSTPSPLSYEELKAAEVILATCEPFSIWNFYRNEDEARADMERANKDSHSARTNHKPYEVMNYQAYKKAEADSYRNRSEEEITEEKFWDALEVLPPMKWTREGDFERFFLSEAWSGSYYHQYVRRGNRYFTKIVDICDKTSWMTR